MKKGIRYILYIEHSYGLCDPFLSSVRINMQGYALPNSGIYHPNLHIRSRVEPNVRDSINIRSVEEWETDPPTYDRSYIYNDVNTIPSRLYRESLDRSAPYQVGQESLEALHLHKERIKILTEIQRLEKMGGNQEALQSAHLIYETLLKAEKQASTESISANPYFDKYDVAGDSRNIVRELRSVVHEDISDRGVSESKKLLGRAFENRFLGKDDIEARRMNTLGYFRA